MPTVDTEPRRWPLTDRSREIKEMIEMLSSLRHLDRVGGKSIRTKKNK